MERKSTRLWDEFTNFYTSAWIDLPFTALRQMAGVKGDDIRAAGWRAYDSWISLMNESTNQLYSNRAFADASGRALEAALTVRHMSDRFAVAASAAIAVRPEASVELSAAAISAAVSQSRDGSRSGVTGRVRKSGAKAA